MTDLFNSLHQHDDIALLRRALEALEANKFLINGDEKYCGMHQCIDGYYSFDVDHVNNQTNKVIADLQERLK